MRIIPVVSCETCPFYQCNKAFMSDDFCHHRNEKMPGCLPTTIYKDCKLYTSIQYLADLGITPEGK